MGLLYYNLKDIGVLVKRFVLEGVVYFVQSPSHLRLHVQNLKVVVTGAQLRYLKVLHTLVSNFGGRVVFDPFPIRTSTPNPLYRLFLYLLPLYLSREFSL